MHPLQLARTCATGSACQLSWMSVMMGTPNVSFTFFSTLRQQQRRRQRRVCKREWWATGSGQAGGVVSCLASTNVPSSDTQGWESSAAAAVGPPFQLNKTNNHKPPARQLRGSPQALLHAGATE